LRGVFSLRQKFVAKSESFAKSKYFVFTCRFKKVQVWAWASKNRTFWPFSRNSTRDCGRDLQLFDYVLYLSFPPFSELIKTERLGKARPHLRNCTPRTVQKFQGPQVSDSTCAFKHFEKLLFGDLRIELRPSVMLSTKITNNSRDICALCRRRILSVEPNDLPDALASREAPGRAGRGWARGWGGA
jgi:hypothetical protein